MAPPEPEPPETDVRRCPTCQGERITNVGPVFAYGEIIKVRYRCETCGTLFWFVRTPVI